MTRHTAKIKVMEFPRMAMAREASFSKPLSVRLYILFMNSKSLEYYDSSFVVRIRPIPAMKKIIPIIPNMRSDLISRVPPEVLTNTIAA